MHTLTTLALAVAIGFAMPAFAETAPTSAPAGTPVKDARENLRHEVKAKREDLKAKHAERKEKRQERIAEAKEKRAERIDNRQARIAKAKEKLAKREEHLNNVEQKLQAAPAAGTPAAAAPAQ